MPDQQVMTTKSTSLEPSVLKNTTIQDLKAQLYGALLSPEDAGYDEARTVWNGMVDKHPALIARCTGTDDVITCVKFAREHDLLVSVRGGGHNYAGKAVCEGGLMIDLSSMKDIHVDTERRTARAQAGLRLGEFDIETQKFGLATTLGVNTDTGISGLTLGGGYGWLAGKYGLACDNLVAAEVVTADGQVLEVNGEQNDDLFWGLRGAGANFGIVTTFEYQLHPLDGPVLGGMTMYPLNEAVLRFYDEFSRAAPDELTTVGDVLTDPEGQPAFGIFVCYCGVLDNGEDVVKPLRTFARPLTDTINWRPYCEMQTLFDAEWPPGRLYYNRGHNVRTLNDGAVRVILEYAQSLPTSYSNIAFQQLHGAASRVPETATAFPHRYDHYDLMVHPATDDPADAKNMIRWARECWGALQPFVEQALYVNVLEDNLEEGEQRVREAYGPNYERLVALKNTYDPTNFFRLNANIKPTV